MIDHLNEFHQVEAKKQVINFENEKLLMDWKEKEELKNFVYYSNQHGDRNHNYLFINILFANTTVTKDLIGKTGTLLKKVTENLGEVKLKQEFLPV